MKNDHEIKAVSQVRQTAKDLNFQKWLLFEKLKSLMHETSHNDNIILKALEYMQITVTLDIFTY